MTIEEFFKGMIGFFPEICKKIDEHISEYGERLDTIVIEEVIMPEVISLLKKDTEEEKLKVIFAYFENVSSYSDKYLYDVFFTTVLEILGNDKNILEKAKKYMGPVTTELQIEADIAIGRQV